MLNKVCKLTFVCYLMDVSLVALRSDRLSTIMKLFKDNMSYC